MNKMFFACLLLICFNAMSQVEKVVSTSDGLEISYKYQKIEDGSSKDKYVVSVTATNKNNYGLYYGVKTAKGANGMITTDGLASTSVAKLVVRNSVGFLASDDIKIKGEQTNLFANGQQLALFKFDAGRFYNYEQTFHVKHGDSLIVTFSYNYSPKDIQSFDVDVTQASLEGLYKTSCGGASFSLSIHTDINTNKTYLIQAVNGRQVKWFKTSDFTFTRDFDNYTTITYDKTRAVYYYSNIDGTNCEWTKM